MGQVEELRESSPMNPRIVLATAAVLAIVVSPGAAQTLTQPNSQTKTPPSAAATKSRPAGHVKTCDAYGADFRNIPGTDACIKIGGGVTVDVGH
jgi:Porin subfamily